ncbi:MAG: hypothetical protein ACRETE_04955 [Stenotrophobium sp.]
MGLKKIMLLTGLAFPVIAVAFMNLFSGFTVEREVILNPEKFNMPGQLLRASDGGYFVVGSFNSAWVTKTDASGNELWSYWERQIGKTPALFLTAAPTAEGGVLLCGRREGFGPNALGTAGLIVRLDKNGHEVSRIDPYLQHPDQVDQFTGVTACSRWGDGFMVSGGAKITISSPDGKSLTGDTSTLLRLRSDGTVLWQKTKDWRDPRWGLFSNPRPLSNGDMMFFGFAADNVITRADGDGNVLSVGKYSDSEVGPACRCVTDPRSVDRLRLACVPFGPNAVHKVSIVDFGSDLKIVSKSYLPLPDGMGAGNVFYLADGTLIVSGNTLGALQKFVPTVVAVGPDGAVRAKHEFIGLDEIGASSMLPTGQPGEIVTIRPVERGGKYVTTMTFLRLN